MSSGSRLWIPRLPGPEMSLTGPAAGFGRGGKSTWPAGGEPGVELPGLLRGEQQVGGWPVTSPGLCAYRLKPTSSVMALAQAAVASSEARTCRQRAGIPSSGPCSSIRSAACAQRARLSPLSGGRPPSAMRARLARTGSVARSWAASACVVSRPDLDGPVAGGHPGEQRMVCLVAECRLGQGGDDVRGPLR